MKRCPKIKKALVHAFFGAAFMAAFLFSSGAEAQLLLVFCVMALYAAPMAYTLFVIKRYEVEGVRGFILSDLLYAFFPSLLSAALFELIYAAAASLPGFLTGIGTLIFIGTAFLMTVLFWLLYFLAYLRYR